MVEANILVLDFSSGSALSDHLQAILESSERLSVRSQWARIQEGNLVFSSENFACKSSSFNPDLVFLVLPTGFAMPAGMMSHLKNIYPPKTHYMVVCEGEPSEEIYAILILGVDDYIIPPLRTIDVLPRIWRLVEKAPGEKTLKQAIKESVGLSELVGKNRTFVAEVSKIPAVAKCGASILILGETGTGKEVFARAIHYLSDRAGRPFIPVNCGALPLELVENELFGHERGAYTNATTSRFGLIHEAEGGTLFLDEVDCLPAKAQVKLLRFLQDREYRPLGSTKNCKADVRVIAATNIDVESAVKDGRLRQDLYYRLNVIPLTIPPLRERPQDVLLLARHFLTKYADEFKKQVTDFSLEAVEKLMSYDWPGNVRELEHIVERAVVFSSQEIIQDADLSLINCASGLGLESFRKAKGRVVEKFEKAYLQRLLVTYQGNITRAAEAAQKHRRAFWQLIRKYNIDVKSLKSDHRIS